MYNILYAGYLLKIFTFAISRTAGPDRQQITKCAVCFVHNFEACYILYIVANFGVARVKPFELSVR